MPFYEYRCEKCGHDVEVMQKITDSPLKKCPNCGKSSLKRLMSAPVFRLKGSGWYETDFKGDQDSKRNLADKAEPDVKDDKADAKKDVKKDEAKADAPGAATPGAAAPAAKDATPAVSKPKSVPGKAKPTGGRKAAAPKKTASKAKKRR